MDEKGLIKAVSSPRGTRIFDVFDKQKLIYYNVSEITDINMPNMPSVPTELLSFLKSIASESRIKILLLFLDGQARTVNQITEMVGLGQSTTSEHLTAMKHAGLVLSEKQGKEVYYRPDPIKITEQLDVLGDLLRKCCDF